MREIVLKNRILECLLEYKDKGMTDFEIIRKEKHIEIESTTQKYRILKALKEDGYINAIFSEGGELALVSITSKGVDYTEERMEGMARHLSEAIDSGQAVEKLEQTAKWLKSQVGTFVDTEELKNDTNDDTLLESPQLWEVEENYPSHIDQSVQPCFGVETLSQSFVKQIDSIVDSNSDNVCMVGIFAPWGRGKSYFFKKVSEIINARTTQTIPSYDIVEFNAWKYQETPAIWAYLFETLFRHKSCWFRFWYTLFRNWKYISLDILIGSIPIILAYVVQFSDTLKCVTWGFVSISLVVNFLLKHYESAISLIRKYSKKISFANEMGVQAEIEKELSALLKNWICKKDTAKKKVILYVDDIDRCPETKMISIIDSLRTVLENNEIRKRLIVVCSVDPDKLMQGIKYKYNNLYSEPELSNRVIQQMDKLFLTGIALPKLREEQMVEFIEKLAQPLVPDTSVSLTNIQTTPWSHQSTGSFFAIHNGEEIPQFNNTEIYRILSNYVRSKKLSLTLRKIRIIYYRIVFAKNIIACDNGNTRLPETVIEAIFDFSCGMNSNAIKENYALYDIMEMVVPYGLKMPPLE